MNSLRHSITTLAGIVCATGLALAELPAAPDAPTPAPHGPGAGRHHTPRLQPYLGVVTAEPSEALRAQLGLAEGQGILVEAVTPGSPAEKAGILRHDVLKLFNDQILCNTDQLATLVRQAGKGASVTLTLIHKGKEEKVSATLDEQPARPPFQPFAPFAPMNRMNAPHPQWSDSPSVNVTVDGEKIQEQIEKAVQEAVGKVGLGPQKLQELQKEIQKNVEHAQQQLQELQGAVEGHRPPHTAGKPDVKAEIKVQVQADEKKPDGSNGVSIQIGEDGGAVSIAPGMSLSYSNHQDQNNSSGYALSDATGSYTLNTHNGHRVFTAKDKDGKTIFDGPVNSEAERKAVPDSVRGKLNEMEKPRPQPSHPQGAPTPAPAPDTKPSGDPL